MLLDHKTAFADYQPVNFLMELTAAPATKPALSIRPQIGGFLPCTRVETADGFVQVRNLRPGDEVQTFDGGLQEVRNIRHSVPRLTAMVHVPAGALGNEVALDMPSDALVTLDLETADRLFGMPVVVSKLINLVGYNGISTALPQSMARVHIEFEEEELIWAEGGMLMNTTSETEDMFYPLLSLAETRQLLAGESKRALEETGQDTVEAASAEDTAEMSEAELAAESEAALDQALYGENDWLSDWTAEWTANSALEALFGRRAA